MKIIRFENTSSTNTLARELIDRGVCESTLLVAKSQEGGKGQLGRVFSSPEGGLYFSLLLSPKLKPALLPLVTLVTGVACVQQLESILDKPAFLKWPNDVYVQGKKISGILCESVIRGNAENTYIIIGVGMNINNVVTDFPSELHPIVTTVKEVTNQEIELDAFLEELVTRIIANVRELHINPDVLLDQWQNHDYLFRKEVVYTATNLTIRGVGQGISSDGSYQIVDLEGKQHSIVGGQLRLG